MSFYNLFDYGTMPAFMSPVGRDAAEFLAMFGVKSIRQLMMSYAARSYFNTTMSVTNRQKLALA